MDYTIVACGETLWDLLPSGPVLGGACFNFAYRAGTLGSRSIIITRLGRDENGEKAFSLIRELGMEYGHIQFDDVYPTGTVEITLSEQKEPDYYIVPNTAYDHIEYTEESAEIVRNADCICFGTVIQRSRKSRKTLYSLLSGFSGKYRLLDINLRKECYSRETVSESLKRADILKLNETEISPVAEMIGLPSGDIPQTAEAILREAGLSYVVVTLGEYGAFAVSSRGEAVYAPGHIVKLADPCGSGDAFTAAFIHTLLQGGGLKEALAKGNGLGAVVATHNGATQKASWEELAEFLKQNKPAKTMKQLIEYI